MRDELPEFAGRMPRLTFSNVRGNRDRGAAHLADQAKFLFRWKPGCEGVNTLRDHHRLLPNDEVLEITCGFGSRHRVSRHWSLVACHSALSATIGSTRAARRAGTSIATS